MTQKYSFISSDLKLIIEEDIIGYYLIVYKDIFSEVSTEDYLLDSLEEAFRVAQEKFGVQAKNWKLLS